MRPPGRNRAAQGQTEKSFRRGNDPNASAAPAQDKWLLKKLKFVEWLSTRGDLTGSDLRLAIALTSLYNTQRGYAWPDLEYLNETVGLEERTIFRSINRLEQAGVLTTERAGGRPGRANRYRLHFDRMPDEPVYKPRPKPDADEATKVAGRSDIRVTPVTVQPDNRDGQGDNPVAISCLSYPLKDTRSASAARIDIRAPFEDSDFGEVGVLASRTLRARGGESEDAERTEPVARQGGDEGDERALAGRKLAAFEAFLKRLDGGAVLDGTARARLHDDWLPYLDSLAEQYGSENGDPIGGWAYRLSEHAAGLVEPCL